jgi:hypothetical protein
LYLGVPTTKTKPKTAQIKKHWFDDAFQLSATINSNVRQLIVKTTSNKIIDTTSPNYTLYYI